MSGLEARRARSESLNTDTSLGTYSLLGADKVSRIWPRKPRKTREEQGPAGYLAEPDSGARNLIHGLTTGSQGHRLKALELKNEGMREKGVRSQTRGI